MSEDKICERLYTLFRKICGYDGCQHPRPLHDYWQQQITLEDKYFKGLYKYKDTEFYEILHSRHIKAIQDKQILNEEEEKRKQAEKENKEKSKRELLLRNKEKRKKQIDELAKPKDKLKTGKVMLELQKNCRYDNVLNKMIKNEFQDNKVFK